MIPFIMLSMLSISSDMNKGIVRNCLRQVFLSSNYWGCRVGDRYCKHGDRAQDRVPCLPAGGGDRFCLWGLWRVEVGRIYGEGHPGSCQHRDCNTRKCESTACWDGQRCVLLFSRRTDRRVYMAKKRWRMYSFIEAKGRVCFYRNGIKNSTKEFQLFLSGNEPD